LTTTGGFWVLELEPQVRKALGLPAKATEQPKGGPARTDTSALASSTAPAEDQH
jgi:hypothetical protein